MESVLKLTLISSLLTFGSPKLFPYEPRSPLSGTIWPKGSPWPMPNNYETSEHMLTFDPATFRITINVQGGGPCDPLDFAIKKYDSGFLFPTIEGITASPDNAHKVVSELSVTIVGDELGSTECQNYPRLTEPEDSYEHYVLEITLAGSAIIESETVWGALRGIETFAQLIWNNDIYEDGDDPLHFYINVTSIDDFPRFPHRGIMFDTARHYHPEKIFYELMDAMMYNKFNVLHWHVTDDQSFPFVSRKFPELSAKGAYTSRHVYTPDMVERVKNEARLRGIRLILEFDTPGHTQSWGNAYPELLTPCYGKPDEPGTPNPPFHAAYENLDPINEFTYNFTKEFFTEIVQEVSADQYIHLGMDEVYPPCWESSPKIAEFMQTNNMTNIAQVQEYYTERHIRMVKGLGALPIIWQDPLDFGVKVDSEVMVQVWKNWGPDWQTNLQKVLDLGYKTLLSAPWYINYIEYGETWVNYYQADPVYSLPNITEAQQALIYGGEACLWGEFVDQHNIIPRLFPFASAVAERLWTNLNTTSFPATINARDRLDQHRCRMLQRGIPAQPILNGYCGAWEVVQKDPVTSSSKRLPFHYVYYTALLFLVPLLRI